jgi:hypothetical protein
MSSQFRLADQISQDNVLARLRDTCSQNNSDSEQKVHESLVTFLSERLRYAYDTGVTGLSSAGS